MPDIKFWESRWLAGQIGFHRAHTNPVLLAHETRLLRTEPGKGILPGQRVFVPLAGKSLDMTYLAENGVDVVAVEVVESAVEAYFVERGVPFERFIHARGHVVYSGERVAIHVADMLELGPDVVGQVDGIWDRAALVALGPAERHRYAIRIREILEAGRSARMLLATLEHDGEQNASPFSVPNDEVRELYGDGMELLGERDVLDEDPRFKALGYTWCTERAWLIRPRAP